MLERQLQMQRRMSLAGGGGGGGSSSLFRRSSNSSGGRRAVVGGASSGRRRSVAAAPPTAAPSLFLSQPPPRKRRALVALRATQQQQQQRRVVLEEEEEEEEAQVQEQHHHHHQQQQHQPRPDLGAAIAAAAAADAAPTAATAEGAVAVSASAAASPGRRPSSSSSSRSKTNKQAADQSGGPGPAPEDGDNAPGGGPPPPNPNHQTLYPASERSQIRESWESLMRWSKALRRLNGGASAPRAGAPRPDPSNARSSDPLASASKVVVFGGGSFGTAMGCALARKKPSLDVVLLLRDASLCASVNDHHLNRRYLPGLPLPANVRATTDAREAIRGACYAVHAVPVQHSRAFLRSVRGLLPASVPVVCVSKGLEAGTGMMMSEVVQQALGAGEPDECEEEDERGAGGGVGVGGGAAAATTAAAASVGAEKASTSTTTTTTLTAEKKNPSTPPPKLRPAQPAVFLSGPSFAREVMQGRPTAVVAASTDPALAREVGALFASPALRVNTSTDVLGVEICGALKNVLAIAAGIVEGLELGNNALAALVAQGCAEIRWLAERMGAQPSTVSGLSGLGDIMLTCYGDLSRNRTVGLRLGRGEALQDILASSSQVAEGVATAGTVAALARRYRVSLPVLTAVAQVLAENLDAAEAVAEIMRLPQIEES
jgi:glycerol-3-phosphate dehydrogenase